jgi:PAS domain S-box-containing protein
MKKKPDPPADALPSQSAAELRRRAEEQLQRQRPAGGGQRTEVETARLVHELQVHQIELEMQNEELKTSQAKVDAGLALYANLYDFAPTGYLTIDREGTIRLANLTGAQMLGVERSRLAKRRFGQFVAESDRRAFADFLQRVFASEAKESCEVTLPRAGLPPFVVQIEGTRSADGLECRGVMLDITARKRAEVALRESEEQFRAIFEMASVGIAQADIRTGQYLRVNQKLCAITGYSAAELLRLHISEVTHPDDRPSDWEAFQRVVRGEQPDYRMEKRYIRKDGALAWVNVNMTVIRDAAGQPTRTVAMIEDITGRKLAEEALRQSETELQVTLEATADGILAVDNKGKVVKTNRRFAEFWRIPPAFLENHDDQAMLAFVLNQLSEPEAFLKKVQALYGSDVVDLDTIAFKDGRVFERYSAPMLMAGRITGRVWSFRDITERKRLEAQVAETYLQLIAASRQAGIAEFATGILHSVGNMLNSVGVASTCVADILQKSKSANLSKVVALLRDHQADLSDFLTRDPKGKQVPEYLAQLAGQLATEQAAVLQELAGLQKNIAYIKDVVSTQQSMAKTSSVSETRSITELVEDAVRMNASDLARHGIQVIRQFEEVPPFAIEKNKVLQILVNLVRNAKQAYVNSDHQGKTLTLHVTRKQDCVCVAISDNGVGIPPENLERIFAHGFTTKKDGHGFGLHNCVVAAGEIGGSLTVHSDGPGQGATFTLEIPCHRPEVARE